jgi:hypothetical protein
MPLVLGIPERVDEEIELEEDELGIYVGTYHPGRSPRRVHLEDGVLRISGMRLRPVGTHVFVSAVDAYETFTFKVESGRSVSLTIEREGRTTVAPRVN